MEDQKTNEINSARPPVVAVLGHIDHGKTSLLDYIRKAKVVASEHGGITQHIGAYQVDWKGQKITFIDTPGHAAFEKMRSRGAEVADIALLVVAADDGVKPQTIEAIKHIKNSGAEMIVVINKIDLPNISIDKVKGELASHEVNVESLGGPTVSVEVSAKTGEGIDKLLETIALVGQMKELKAEMNMPFEGVVIESLLDKFRGPIASIIVKKGKLSIGDKLNCEGINGKVKALVSDSGLQLKTALPSTPVEILGLETVVPVGATIKSGERVEVIYEAPVFLTPLEALVESQKKKDKLQVVIKADVAGSLEAVLANLPAEVEVVSSGSGEVNESDIKTAKITSAPILGFNTKIPGQVAKLAEREGVIIQNYKVIYELLDDLTDAIAGIAQEKEKSRVVASAKITNEFIIEDQKIAGCKVTSGKFSVGDTVTIVDANAKPLGTTEITSIKQRAKVVPAVSAGAECGMTFSSNLDFKIGDIVELEAH